MPKGQRTYTNDFEKSTFKEPQVTVTGAAISENVPEKPLLAKKAIIGTGKNFEDIIHLDQDGAMLVFEQTDKFLPLSDEQVALLSLENRLRYQMAKDFHDAWRGDEVADLVEKFQVDRNLSGSATSKLTIEGQKGMHIRWARPDMVETYRAKGYKIIGADEARSFLGPRGDHHEVGKLGQTELVAMGIPEAIFNQRMKEKTRKNTEMAGAWKQTGKEELNRAGVASFVATEDDKHRWAEIDNGEN